MVFLKEHLSSNDILLITPCYVNGNVTNGNNPADVLVGIDYDRRGNQNGNIYYADKDEIGSTWGIAYTKRDKMLFMGAFLKRHVGLRESGRRNPLGAIYAHDFETSNNSLY